MHSQQQKWAQLQICQLQGPLCVAAAFMPFPFFIIDGLAFPSWTELGALQPLPCLRQANGSDAVASRYLPLHLFALLQCALLKFGSQALQLPRAKHGNSALQLSRVQLVHTQLAISLTWQI